MSEDENVHMGCHFHATMDKKLAYQLEIRSSVFKTRTMKASLEGFSTAAMTQLVNIRKLADWENLPEKLC